MPLSNIEDAIKDIQAGRMVIVVDDEDRENEGDLTLAAEKVTPEAINFMARHGRGLICLPMTAERLAELQIPMMVAENTSPYGTAFTISIEARDSVSTGISAADRATTILTVVNPATRPEDLARPGHVFPLRARSGGVLERAGQTEAAVDLARLAGLYPAGVICEIINDDGTMARLPELKVFAARFGLKIISIADLVQYRLLHEHFVHEVDRALIPTEYGSFTAVVFQTCISKDTHLAMVKGDISGEEPVYVRVHTQSTPADVFFSHLNPAGLYLHKCLRFIAKKNRGVVLYLRMDSDGQRLVREIRAYREGRLYPECSPGENPSFEKERRDHGIGAQILRALGLKRVILLSGHSRKFKDLHGFGIEIVRQENVECLGEECVIAEKYGQND